jgi:hypothetical protein
MSILTNTSGVILQEVVKGMSESTLLEFLHAGPDKTKPRINALEFSWIFSDSLAKCYEMGHLR